VTAESAALGRQGEALAERHMARLGARVLARNYRCPFGEADLVVDHGGDLVAVEVKTRRPGSVGLPEEAVGRAKRNRLERVLAYFSAERGIAGKGWRIDVVAVELAPDGAVHRLEHIRDAAS